MLEVVMEYYLVGLVVTLLLSLVYLSINLFRDKINMLKDKGVWLAIIGYSLLSYIGLIIVLYVLTTIFKGSRYEKYNFK